MTYCEALKEMIRGCKVRRLGWENKGVFLFIIKTWDFETDISGVDDLDVVPFICVKTEDNRLAQWLASQTDGFCGDWEVVDE